MYREPVQVVLTHPDAKFPKRATVDSAGWDLHVIESGWILPLTTRKFRTGLRMALPRWSFGHITSRSSMFRDGLDADGTIDADYRGELLLQLRNVSWLPRYVNAGDRVAQMKILDRNEQVEMVPAVSLDETVRGTKGFGSSGRA